MRVVVDDGRSDAEAEQRAWEEHNLAQLEHFRSLSLREKLEAVEGMADVVRRLHEMRERGELSSASDAESDKR
ncbi:MAG: hypothetical protein ACXW12_14965 [Burkholderiales bacterium]